MAFTKLILKTLLLCSIVMAFSFSTAKDQIIGTWAYEVTNSQDGYDKGQLVFSEKEGKTVCYVLVNYDKIQTRNLTIDKKQVTFKVTVEGYTIDVKLKMEADKFTGKASFSEGVLDLKGKKIKI